MIFGSVVRRLGAIAVSSVWRAQKRRGLHTNVIDTLRERNFIHDVTSQDIHRCAASPVAVYCGVDPTAESLHLGNMVTLMSLLHFHVAGHQAIPLVGNATGMIGDPSGRSSERVALDRGTLANNIAGIEAQLERFFTRGTQYALKRIPEIDAHSLKEIRILHNADWYHGMNVLTFLGSVGRYSRVGAMMARDSVKARLGSASGISFTEFSYQLLQAYDFWYLFHNHGCRIQIGGSDQWGNITAGTDLIHRMDRDQAQNTGVIREHSSSSDTDSAFGLTIPLLTTSSGEKFGKSAGNAIWLDERKTSPFDIYQFFIKTADSDVERFLKMFTFLPLKTIQEVVAEHQAFPEKFAAQRMLAAEVTELIHGESGVQQALCATEVLFGGGQSSIQRFSASDFASAFAHDKRMMSVSRSAVCGKTISDIAVLAGACKSKSEASRLVRGGGLYWNNQPVSDAKWIPTTDFAAASAGNFVGDGTIGIIRIGKTNYHLLRLLDSD
ncbi:tyrosyl-tRNA synthetase [Coemansia sp. RSA 1813]|nr:tyrosyl-tRNA synthetase [Coemansia sp. RSA 1646]KAJ1771085.1 tyrosyl-tRNA synthetase [Coemansia sp. RSA 1843]KAJ2214786.1 tyrosyl-tRNA synthetase [Coemansia sp. RSA 487]KAJ2569773.1 tyrosyl-tRNA synthetase [Coemansia sp. RSA 1813]